VSFLALFAFDLYPPDFDCSETTSIPTNPRTTRPVGYAFVDVSTPSEAERAISELNGKTILDRKVSVQLARKPEPAQEGTETAEPARRRSSTRGRGRGRGRGGRTGRGRVSHNAQKPSWSNTDHKHRVATPRARLTHLPTLPMDLPTSLARSFL
jgi:RNA recognition motif-containing protein